MKRKIHIQVFLISIDYSKIIQVGNMKLQEEIEWFLLSFEKFIEIILYNDLMLEYIYAEDIL